MNGNKTLNPAFAADAGNGDGAAALIGEWEWVAIGDDNHRQFFVFSSPNKLKLVGFSKVDNFWIENHWDITWNTEGKTLYIDELDPTQYSISDNILTITFTDAEAWKLTKINLSSFRGTLGTVRTQDSLLSGTHWILDDKRERLGLYAGLYIYSGFGYDGNRYFGNGKGGSGSWYTSGSNLFLIDTDWECLDPPDCDNGRRVVTETVQFTYTLSTSGGVKTLRLTNSSKGINDQWRWITQKEYDDSKGLSKSRQPNQSRSNATRLFGLGR
jgi:hypothetical protein